MSWRWLRWSSLVGFQDYNRRNEQPLALIPQDELDAVPLPAAEAGTENKIGGGVMKRHQQILIGVLVVQVILSAIIFWPKVHGDRQQ